MKKILRKSLALIPAILLVGSTAFASEVITLPNGSQVCSFPCAHEDDPVIVLEDGRQVCPLQLPTGVEADVFVVKLNSDGADMIRGLRPYDSESEQFAVNMDYHVTQEYVAEYGEIVGGFHLLANIPKDSWKSVGNVNLSVVDSVSIIANGNGNVGPTWRYKIDKGIVSNITKTGCDDSPRVESNVLISHLEGFVPIGEGDSAFFMPLVKVLATDQMRNAVIGEGVIFGGFKNLLEGDASADYAVFVNVSEKKDYFS